jgi:DNA-binding response OmpR family regulator
VELIRLTLDHSNFTIEMAATFERATALVNDWQPHLVILDGHALIDQIGTKPDGGLRLPVVGLTRRGDLNCCICWPRIARTLQKVMSVDRHVRNLRARLKDPWRRPRYIQTVPGRGYRFVQP